MTLSFDEFENFFANETISWKKIFNHMLGVTIEKNSRIKVESFQKIVDNIRWLNLYDDAIFLNWFYAKLFFGYRSIFQFYSLVGSADEYTNDRHRNYQRHEQCIEYLEDRFPYTMPVISKKLIGKDARDLIHQTLIRISVQAKILIDKLQISSNQKQSEKNKIDDYMFGKIFNPLLPDLEPNDELKLFLESFNSDDAIISFVMGGESFEKDNLNIQRYRYHMMWKERTVC